MGTTLGMNSYTGFPAVLAIMTMNITSVDITSSTVVLISLICMLALESQGYLVQLLLQQL